MNTNPAMIVLITAGKDKGKYQMVLDVLDDNHVLVCDGRRRRVEAPKKKKLKHIKSLEYSLYRIKEKLEEGSKINNSEVRREIRRVLLKNGILTEE